MQISNESVGDLSFIFIISSFIYFNILAILTLMLDLDLYHTCACYMHACQSHSSNMTVAMPKVL